MMTNDPDHDDDCEVEEDGSEEAECGSSTLLFPPPCNLGTKIWIIVTIIDLYLERHLH